MRILMTTDNLGGVWTYCLQLAAALEGRGVEIHLASMGVPVSAEQRAAVAERGNLRLHASTYKLEWMDQPWADVDKAGDWVLELERRLRPDVIHLNGYAHAALPLRAPKLVVGHSCVLSWYAAVKRSAAPAWTDEYRRRVMAGLQAADHVLAPSQAMLACLTGHYGPLKSSGVIYNGRSGSTFRPGTKVNFVFSAGRLWDEAKNVAALDAAAGEIAWPVYVAGDNAHPTTGDLTAPPCVRCLGFLRERPLAAWLSLAAIYALPARYEPFGLSILEAALAGCALVLGDIPSLREIWDNAAVYVPPDDPGALAAAINGLIVEPARRARLSARASLRARTYSPQRMADAYVQTYGALVSPSGARAADGAVPAASGHVG